MKYISESNGTCSSWSRSKILSYEVKLIFSVFGRIFIVCAWFWSVQPMFNKFESLSTFESHQDWESSTWLIQMHIQAFRKISSLVIFRLSSCDSSPPLKMAVGGSSKVRKWVRLTQIWFRQLLWVLGGKRKRWSKTHFYIFRSIDCDLSTSSLKSSDSNILVSAHPIGKLKIVPESLRSGEEMVIKPFWYFDYFTSRNPCDS